jgi:2-polyprenyl-6-methoxyphenol hydroxylase-like FAD-dependent oxidoreductase
MPRELWKKELRERFGQWHAPIPELLAATPESAFLCNEMMDREMDKRTHAWGEGAVTLLGDAAHPTTPNLGQGACMAIEDAAVAAQAIECLPEVDIAFRVYERTRYERTAMIVRESLKFGRIGQWENGVACGLRNFALRFAPDSTLRKQFQELWMYDAWGAPLVMPH